MTEKKPSALESASPPDALESQDVSDPTAPRPCALLTPDKNTTAPSAPEDESADPVGDGHSDAEFAAEHPKPAGKPPDNAAASPA